MQVEYTGGFQTFNSQRFGQQFVNKVANPRDLLNFFRRRTAPAKREKLPKPAVGSLSSGEQKNWRYQRLTPVLPQPTRQRPDMLTTTRVEDLVERYDTLPSPLCCLGSALLLGSACGRPLKARVCFGAGLTL